MAKNEHDFINPWVEYHLKIGFSYFYILVDNICEKQPEYIIDEKFKEFVTLIYAEENDIAEYFCELGSSLTEILKNHHYSILPHALVNHKIVYKNIIKEDWCTTIGIDQYIYLNGNTIQDYLSNINDDCTQIIVPWSFCCINTYDSNFDNFLENFHLYKSEYAGTNGHSNGLIKTKNLFALDHSTHSFISKTELQKIYIIDEYFEFNKSLHIFDIFCIVQKKLDIRTFDNLKISSFHFIIRNVNEIFIKNLFSWGKLNIETFQIILYQISQDIKNNTKKCLIDYNLIQRLNIVKDKRNDFSEKLFELELSLMETKNSSEYYDNLLLKELFNYDVIKEEFDLWKKTLFVLE
jgi:hypothetical protein